MKKTLLVTLQACVLAAIASSAVAADKLVFGIALEPYPPFSFKSGKGDWSGFEPEMITAVCAQMKAECTLNEMSWDGLIPALKSQQVDVVLNSLSITPERQQVIDFTQPYFFTRALWIGESALPLEATPEGLKGKIIGVQVSTVHQAYVEKYFAPVAAEVKTYQTQDEANQDLVAGRVDAIQADSIALDAFLTSEAGAACCESKGAVASDPEVLGLGPGQRRALQGDVFVCDGGPRFFR